MANYYFGRGGSDTLGDGLSPETAWATFAHALLATPSGNTLVPLDSGADLSATDTGIAVTKNLNIIGRAEASPVILQTLEYVSPYVVTTSAATETTVSNVGFSGGESESGTSLAIRSQNTPDGHNLIVSDVSVEKTSLSFDILGDAPANMTATVQDIVLDSSELSLFAAKPLVVAGLRGVNSSIYVSYPSGLGNNQFTANYNDCQLTGTTLTSLGGRMPTNSHNTVVDNSSVYILDPTVANTGTCFAFQTSQPGSFGGTAANGLGNAGTIQFNECVGKSARGVGVAFRAARVNHNIGVQSSSSKNQALGHYLSEDESPLFDPNNAFAGMSSPDWGTRVLSGYVIQAGSNVLLSYNPTPVYNVTYTEDEATNFFFGAWLTSYPQLTNRADNTLTLDSFKAYDCYGGSIVSAMTWKCTVSNARVVSTKNNRQRTYGHLNSLHRQWNLGKGSGAIQGGGSDLPVSNESKVTYINNKVIVQNTTDILACIELDHSAIFDKNVYFIPESIDVDTQPLFRQEITYFGDGGFNTPANTTAAQWFALDNTPNVSASPEWPFAYTKTVIGSGSVQHYSDWADGLTLRDADAKLASTETIVKCPEQVLIALSNLNRTGFAPRQKATYYVSNSEGNGFGLGVDSLTGVNGYTKQTPYQSIDIIKGALAVGDTVVVNAGIYGDYDFATETRLRVSEAMEFTYGDNVYAWTFGDNSYVWTFGEPVIAPVNSHNNGLLGSIVGNVLSPILGSILG
jgi:hypothetical protein